MNASIRFIPMYLYICVFGFVFVIGGPFSVGCISVYLSSSDFGVFVFGVALV